MGAKRFKDSYEVVKVRGEKGDFSKEITNRNVTLIILKFTLKDLHVRYVRLSLSMVRNST